MAEPKAPAAPAKRGLLSNLAKMFSPFPADPPIQATNPPATDLSKPDPVEDLAVATVMPPVIDQELGVSVESYYTRFELNQYSPDDLVTKKGFKIFEKMYLDDQIHMAITALKLMRLSGGYEVNEASQDPRDIEIADFVADNLTKLEGGLQDALFNMMGALEMGWSINEKIWDFYTIGPWEGRVRLKALKSKNPQWFNPTVDDFNNLTGVAMISPPAYGRKLPADKFVVYSFMKRYENVFGTARTRALYDWWWIKQVTRRALGVFIEKFGHPTAVGKYPLNMQADNRTALLTALRQIKIASAITMPDGCTVDFLEASKQGAEAFLQTIEKCDQQMVKVIMGQTMSSGTSSAQAGGKDLGSGMSAAGGHGSGAAGQQMDVLTMYLDYIGRHVAEGPMATLVKEMVDYNWSGVVNYPTFKFKPLNEEDLSGSVGSFVSAATGGLVTPGPEDEEHIREILGFPSAQGKNVLRPNRYLNKPKPVTWPDRKIIPQELPWAGYRPPTPSGPGLPANYAEGKFKPSRKLTQYEAGVDFSETLDILENDRAELVTAAAVVLRKAVEKVKVQAKSRYQESSWVKKLELPYRGELATVLRDGLEATAKRAMKQAKTELRAKRRATEFTDLGGFTPTEVLKLIDDEAFTMAGDVSADVLKRIKRVLYDGISAGKSYKDIVYDVEGAIADYVNLTQSTGDLAEHRLETAVRTATAEAYNKARQNVFMAADQDDFVLAFQFSAILDDRTTEWCNEMDGRIFSKTNSIWELWRPPTFFNCRSVLVPVTRVDGWDGKESEPPSSAPPGGF